VRKSSRNFVLLKKGNMIRELNHVIDYIEEHLTDEISLETIADYAGVSDFHFRKVFFHLSGMTLSEYIKK
jgi:AraC family transcriptional regulator